MKHWKAALIITLLALGVTVVKGCGSQSNKPPYYLKDVSHLDGPYEFVSVDNQGVLILEKDDKEYSFELLGLSKGETLNTGVSVVLVKGWPIWIDYDQEKYSPEGNLRGYAYYRHYAAHDIKTKEIFDQEYRMINMALLGAYADFVDDHAIRKHFEHLLNEVLLVYQSKIEGRRKGLTDISKGTIWTTRTTEELETKLAEYEKMLAEYREKKTSQ